MSLNSAPQNYHFPNSTRNSRRVEEPAQQITTSFTKLFNQTQSPPNLQVQGEGQQCESIHSGGFYTSRGNMTTYSPSG